MVLALNVSVYFCKLLPLHMNGNLPVGIGMHVFAMICDLMRAVSGAFPSLRRGEQPTRSGRAADLRKERLLLLLSFAVRGVPLEGLPRLIGPT
eukprot:UN2026